mmetsp:Transcript_340/g.479  ORF Transcript_340/g.479 Transcript_340/m.479 type:complete len:559 (-) Transcript_340:42-1718(-)
MWKEFKTGKSCPISFFPDFCSYLIDWCHCMFCYLVSDGSDSYSTQSSGVPDGNTFLFPSLRHKDQNAIARDVTALLHKVAKTGKVVGLTQKHSSQGFKHGAADDCSFNSNCPVPSTVARAGWDYSGEGMIFYYIFKAFHVATAGKTLAGWKIPKNDVFPPDCKAFLTDYNVDQYEAFCKTLFSGVRVPDLHDISRLKAFRDQMVATFLMYMPEYEDDLGGNDQVLNIVIRSAHEVTIGKHTLQIWGKLIKSKFELDNGASNVDNSLHPEVVKSYQQMSRELEEVKCENKEMANQLLAMNTRMTKLTDTSVEKNETIERLGSKIDSLVNVLGNVVDAVNNSATVAAAAAPAAVPAASSAKKRPLASIFTSPPPAATRPQKKQAVAVTPLQHFLRADTEAVKRISEMDCMQLSAKSLFVSQLLQNRLTHDMLHLAKSPTNRVKKVWEEIKLATPPENMYFLERRNLPKPGLATTDDRNHFINKAKATVDAAVMLINDRRVPAQQVIVQQRRDDSNVGKVRRGEKPMAKTVTFRGELKLSISSIATLLEDTAKLKIDYHEL